MNEVVLGIDLGTQGVRVLAVNPRGVIIASSSRLLESGSILTTPEGSHEQDPKEWWDITKSSLKELLSSLSHNTEVVGIAIDSTSGTIIPLDQDNNPVHAALMYNDSRSEIHLPIIRRAGATLESSLGYSIGSSFGLSKIYWLKLENFETYSKTARFIHAADFLIGKLTGCFDTTDHSNALKTGYDLINHRWPDFIENELGIDTTLLPDVIKPGEQIGKITQKAAEETGLQPGIPVFGGATDGTAAQISSGSMSPGSWVSTLGTTLVVKGITRNLLLDPQKRFYSHLHPEGWWMPGGASNTGSEWIKLEYPGEDPAHLDQAAKPLLPTPLIRYPLKRIGERFPFHSSSAEGFTCGSPDSAEESYAAGLEGLAMVEKLCYLSLQEAGAEAHDRIYVSGGGARSSVWLQIRASVLQIRLIRPKVYESAMGAAIIAASGAWFGNISSAALNLVQVDLEVEPVPEWREPYLEKYELFCDILHEKGYLDS